MSTLDQTLSLLATREPDEAHVQAAQRSLEAVIAAHTARAARSPVAPRGLGGWLAATTSAAVVAAALLLSPLTSTPALAFSAVQQHFRDFRTLRFEVEQRMNGSAAIASRVSVTAAGDVRTDIGQDVTVIVNNTERRVLMLQHAAHVAVVMPLIAEAEQDAALRWLKEIRDFQGAAQPLSEARVIGGQPARGWRLETAGSTLELWADATGVPLRMTVGDGSRLQLDFRFEFDVELAPRMFSTQIPPGYSPGKEED